MAEVVVASFPTPYFDVKILKGTEKFPYQLPPMSGAARVIRDHSSFVAKKKSDYLRRYDRSLLEAIDTAKDFSNRVIKYGKVVEPILTDYDKEEVLPATCALGSWKSASTDFENIGYLGLDTDVTYPKDVIDVVVEWYTKYLPPAEEARLSMVRGKQIGYPFMVGGSQRSLNDMLMAISASLVLGNHTRNGGANTLETLYGELRRFHGDPFCMEGSREQTTGKEIAMVLNEGIFSSTNFNPRYRIINMESKLSVMDIRSEIKHMLGSILAAPNHEQDRAKIRARIEGAQAKGWRIVSTDYSKFDFRHGGKRGLQQVDLHATVLKSERYRNSATLSFKTRAFIYGYGKLWEYPGDALLKSGMGNTTLIGCTGNFTGMIAALSHGTGKSPRELIGSYGTNWDALMWGDDAVVMFQDHTWYDALKRGYSHYKLEVSEEPTIKFLGSNYFKGDFDGTMDPGYSVGRAFQQQFFPERTKLYPFNLVGYIARLDLMGPDKAEGFHDRMKPLFGELELGDSFSFSTRHDVLRKLIPEMQRQAEKLGLLDDVLQVFTHGLQGDDFGGGDIPAIYYELLGIESSIDLSDPLEFIAKARERDPKTYNAISQGLLTRVKSVLNGDFSQYGMLLSELTMQFRLSYQNGSVIY